VASRLVVENKPRGRSARSRHRSFASPLLARLHAVDWNHIGDAGDHSVALSDLVVRTGESFAPVALIARVPTWLVVNPAVPVVTTCLN